MNDASRDHGPQPLVGLMAKHELEPKHLVEASTDQLTFKMVSRAMKGRQLTPRVRDRVVDALNVAAAGTYLARDVFSYLRPAGDAAGGTTETAGTPAPEQPE